MRCPAYTTYSMGDMLENEGPCPLITNLPGAVLI